MFVILVRFWVRLVNVCDCDFGDGDCCCRVEVAESEVAGRWMRLLNVRCRLSVVCDSGCLTANTLAILTEF